MANHQRSVPRYHQAMVFSLLIPAAFSSNFGRLSELEAIKKIRYSDNARLSRNNSSTQI